ncbi:hypothetical protein ACJ41O_006749 [Fusarium nematophilum]
MASEPKNPDLGIGQGQSLARQVEQLAVTEEPKDPSWAPVDHVLQTKEKGILVALLKKPGTGGPEVRPYIHQYPVDKASPMAQGLANKTQTLLEHPSFGLYYTPTRFSKDAPDSTVLDEDSLIVDPQANFNYEGSWPGTISVEGFGYEWWDLEAKNNPTKEPASTKIELPSVENKIILARIDELKNASAHLSDNTEKEDADLKELIGEAGIKLGQGSDLAAGIQSLYSILNRPESVDFSQRLSFDFEATTRDLRFPKSRIFDLYSHIIIAKELARRLEVAPYASNGFTPKVWSSLIIQHLWLTNTKLVMKPPVPEFVGIKRRGTLDKFKAEKLRKEAMRLDSKGKMHEAHDLLGKAIKLDPSSVKAWINRGVVAKSLGKHMRASSLADFEAALKIDPNNIDALGHIGLDALGAEDFTRSREAYERAVGLIKGSRVKSDVRATIEKMLAVAKEKEDMEALQLKFPKDEATKSKLLRQRAAKEWDLGTASVEVQSVVHEQQVEGLLAFAEKMEWPYMGELRTAARAAYGRILARDDVPVQVVDWLMGVTLPGRWMAFKIMANIIHLTPSVGKKVGISSSMDSGLVLPTQTYWPIRSVLGRVLAPLPGLSSACGWIGPCPKVEFDSAEDAAKHVELDAASVAPTPTIEVAEGRDLSYHVDTRRALLKRSDGEDEEAYVATIMDESNWSIPEPPVPQQEPAAVQLKSIKLKKTNSKFGVSVAFSGDEKLVTLRARGQGP